MKDLVCIDNGNTQSYKEFKKNSGYHVLNISISNPLQQLIPHHYTNHNTVVFEALLQDLRELIIHTPLVSILDGDRHFIDLFTDPKYYVTIPVEIRVKLLHTLCNSITTVIPAQYMEIDYHKQSFRADWYDVVVEPHSITLGLTLPCDIHSYHYTTRAKQVINRSVNTVVNNYNIHRKKLGDDNAHKKSMHQKKHNELSSQMSKLILSGVRDMYIK